MHFMEFMWIENSENSENHDVFAHHLESSDLQHCFLRCLFFVLFCRRPVASAYLAFIQRRALSFLPKQNWGGIYRPGGGSEKKKWRVAPLRATAAQPRMNESVKRKEKRKRKKRKKRKRKGNSSCLNGKKQKLQHPDFARGPPPHYYPGQNVLNFADQTGCGALTIVWP